MLKKLVLAIAALASVSVAVVCVAAYGSHRAAAAEVEVNLPPQPPEVVATDNGFSVEVIVYGSPTTEYAARGRRYIEAFENAEYELRIHNPLPARVAVALSVDGLNTIDARHTSAWDAHKWVIDPYGTITVSGWQMSSENARRFYFTTERESYATKLGQTANLGVISAVFFRERGPVIVTQTWPKPTYRREDDTRGGADKDRAEQKAPQAGSSANSETLKTAPAYPPPDDESAATGIGRTVRNNVQWVHLDLDPKAVSEVTIRYEYRASLVKLGIVPRDYPRPNVLDRRERAQGFEPKFCPQP